METDNFYTDDLSAVLSFNLPVGHFLAKDYDAHPWSVQLSRYDDSSQTWNPIPANTQATNMSISENTNSEEPLTFSVPIADLSRKQKSIWSITPAQLWQSPILGETLRLEDISIVDKVPAIEGRSLSIVLAPMGKVKGLKNAKD